MHQPLWTTSLAVICLSLFTATTNASEAPKKGQNAFTRAVEKPLAGIITPAPNPKTTRCNSVVDCRKKGHDLETVWQVNIAGEQKPKDYPARCHRLGKDGKYEHSPNTCR